MRGDAHAGERVFGQHRFDGFLPEDLAIDAVDADEMPFEVEQVAAEARHLTEEGFRNILLVAGEHPKFAESDQQFLDKVRRYFKKINPALVDADFIDLRASRYRHAQPICDPGYLDRLPPASLPVQGLWVADTSYYYPEDRGISESIGFGRNLAREATR